MEEGFTVAVKRWGKLTEFCGFYSTMEEAKRNAKTIREDWEDSFMVKPTSIRARKVTRQEWSKRLGW